MKIRAGRNDLAVRLTVRGKFVFVGREVTEVEDSEEVREQVERFVKRGYLEIVNEDKQEDASSVQEDASSVQEDASIAREVRRKRRSRR